MARGLVLSWAGMMVVAASVGTPAFAHDMTIGDVYFSNMDSTTLDHLDADPWKGYVEVTVHNSGTIPWGDFHFEIKPYFGSDVSNVDIDTVSFAPEMNGSAAAYVVDNAPVGSVLDYYFYDNPVVPGESASFKFYTDNTRDHVNFGVCMYPTPVPEPSTLSLAFFGLATTLLIRRRCR